MIAATDTSEVEFVWNMFERGLPTKTVDKCNHDDQNSSKVQIGSNKWWDSSQLMDDRINNADGIRHEQLESLTWIAQKLQSFHLKPKKLGWWNSRQQTENQEQQKLWQSLMGLRVGSEALCHVGSDLVYKRILGISRSIFFRRKSSVFRCLEVHLSGDPWKFWHPLSHLEGLTAAQQDPAKRRCATDMVRSTASNFIVTGKHDWRSLSKSWH